MDARHDKRPRTLVLRFLLAPHNFRVRKTREFSRERILGKRVELLDAQKLDAVETALLALLEEIVIDLARAEDDARDLVVCGE